VKYMLIMSEEEASRLSREGDDRIDGSATASALTAWLDEMEARGVLLEGERLESVEDAEGDGFLLEPTVRRGSGVAQAAGAGSNERGVMEVNSST
jgi:hypothetical protein